MRVVVLHPYTKCEVHRPCHSEDMAWHTMCVSINGPGDLDLGPFDLETGMLVVPKVENLRSEFGHARPSDSRVIRYVRDGRTKVNLIAC